MGEIRSALDIAMEKASGIQSSLEGGKMRELRNRGIKAASCFLENSSIDILIHAMEELSADDVASFCNGAFNVFFMTIKLPETQNDIEKMETAAKGISCLCTEPQIPQLFQQASMIFNQFLQERGQLKQMLAQQYIPKLQQKEQELARLYGQGIHLEPEQDPEFNEMLRKQNRQLSARYEPAVAEIISQVSIMTGYSA